MKRFFKIALFSFTIAAFTFASCETKKAETTEESTTPPVDSDEGAAELNSATQAPAGAAEENAASGTGVLGDSTDQGSRQSEQ